MNIIEVKNLKKSYRKIEAVKGVSFEVKQGEIFGLLGPNGAGKTTTLEMLEGLRQPSSGRIKIFGENLEQGLSVIHERCGVVLQHSGYFEYLQLREILTLFSSFYKRRADIAEISEKFELGDLLGRTFAELSGGQRQRFVLAISLLHKPDLVFLDEPTIGLDPAARQKFWDILISLRAEGLTILLTTHYMEEAQILSDRVAIIDDGRIVASGQPVTLINSLGVVSRIQFMSSKPVNVGELEALPGVLSARRDRYTYDLETEAPEVSLRELLDWEKRYSGKIFNLQVKQATLGDVFLKLTGHTLRERHQA
ncbi:MAG: hypothetical protein A2846_02890 [Candidatus Doudnabacteria bacterium RIFCSPHIGHO2_01_FULL_49_9]|uniref:ABC transporter domain-containing protein n=1 Tax=Candidatus Doudnabacteria bacterium RIFCSPHIGHO2_01_FULL_49_9 TaxID=1817827 RepID=A0A1F5NY63_9BACT|nr:MAG: hypothetical protein A2846_02890 [Candidatus Doudnabacteria bacterium RIFCSPHIGHO2_01_FULL_49_9]